MMFLKYIALLDLTPYFSDTIVTDDRIYKPTMLVDRLGHQVLQSRVEVRHGSIGKQDQRVGCDGSMPAAAG